MSGPVWQKNLRDAILLDPLIVTHGNVKDVFPVNVDQLPSLPPALQTQPYVWFDIWLALEFERVGYPIVVLYDPVDGIVALRREMVARFQEIASGQPAQPLSEAPPSTGSVLTGPTLPKATATPVTAESAWLVPLTVRQAPEEFIRTLYENVFRSSSTPVAVVCRFTDRYLSFTDRQTNEERRLSMLIQKAAMTIRPPSHKGPLSSRLALIFNTASEIPLELHTQAPFARSLLVPAPTLDERKEFFQYGHGLFDPGDPDDRFDPAQDSDHLHFVANLSEGLKMQDLFSLATLSRRERLGLGARQVKQLLDLFRFGTRENAWLKVKPESLKNAKEILTRRVKGQDEVVGDVVPVLVRAKLGMTDTGDSQHSTRPRGAFFFVGPTGVGKTELSKAIAELIFGDDKALIRFDMSEYSEEHQQARLIGAPPGYVGFDQGGQLTNAIIEHPFSVVLFDEIEKAHGRILDKFLQILDDGRLTDGMGRTVYFSEAIIIFTSNIGTAPTLGASPRSQTPGVSLPSLGSSTPGDAYKNLATLPYDKLCDHFREEVKDFFVNRLGRPEILNRIGEENILVFRFLTQDDIKGQIVDQQIAALSRMLGEKHKVGLFCTRGFRQLLMVHPNGFARNGARGVRNLLSRFVLSPLAEQLFLQPSECQGKTFRVDYPIDADKIADMPFDRNVLHYEWVRE